MDECVMLPTRSFSTLLFEKLPCPLHSKSQLRGCNHVPQHNACSSEDCVVLS